MNQTYHVGTMAKPGSKVAYTVIPDGHGYHIAECKFRFNAVKIVNALNASATLADALGIDLNQKEKK